MQRNSDKILSEWLVLNAQSGKIKALNQLLILWQPKFLRYSTRQLQNQDAAKDVVQESLITVAMRIKSLNDPAAFPKWSYQILHRRGVDYLRKEIKNRKINHEQSQLEIINATQSNKIDVQIEVTQSLKHLNELQYMLVHLHYLEGLTLKEIAAIMKMPVGTVKSKLHYIRNQLRTLLEEKL